MEPVTLSLVSGALFWGYDRLRARAAADPNNIPDPPELDPAVVNQGTHVLGNVRVFDHDIARGLEAVLGSVSAVRVDGGELGKQVGQVYRILPLRQGEPTGAAVIEHARASLPDCAIIASLTLPILFLPLAQSKPAMLLIVAPPGGESYAARDSHFAVLLPEKRAEKKAAPSEDAAVRKAVGDAPSGAGVATPPTEPTPSTPVEEAPAPVAVANPFPDPPSAEELEALRARHARERLASPFPPPPEASEQEKVNDAIRKSIARSNGVAAHVPADDPGPTAPSAPPTEAG